MRINSRFFSATALVSIAIGFMTAGCMEDNPIDYTTGAVAVGDGSQQSDVSLDTEDPVAVSLMIDNGAASTSNTAVTLDMDATDDVAVTDYYASESAATPQASDSGWQSYQQSTSFTLSGSNSLGVFQRTVYVWFKDAAGNVSSNSVSASISLGVYDTTAPTAVSVVIEECSYYIKDPGLMTAYWETSSNPAALSAGTYTLAGDLNAALADETDAEIESYPLLSIPTGVSVTAAGDPLDANVYFRGCEDLSSTTSSSVTLTLSATDDQAVTNYYASESAVTPQAGDNGWDNYSTSVSYSFDNDTAETKTVNVWFKDAAGNVSGSVADSIERVGLSGVADRMSAGAIHTCTIKNDKTLQCWGANIYGQSTVPDDLGEVSAVSAGGLSTCVIKVDGTAHCWGENGSGQNNVPVDLGVVKQISAGQQHTCAVKVDGTAHCWGSNYEWGSFVGQSNVPTDLGLVKSISAGRGHTCAIKEDSTVNCWGSSSIADLSVPGDLGLVSSISAGYNHTCAVRADDTAQCWGANYSGESTPPADLGTVKSVISGKRNHTCAIKADDTLQCWGDDSFGKSTVPSGLGSVKSVAAGEGHTCAIKVDDSVACWGSNMWNGGLTPVPAELQ